MVRRTMTTSKYRVVQHCAFDGHATWTKRRCSVVTVHGIRDDYRTAWTDTQGLWWVRNQLFKDLSIREVDYSYEIDAAAVIYATNGIMQHAQKLVEEYAEVRRKLEEVRCSASTYAFPEIMLLIVFVVD
jgi:hypothetical protein